MDRQYLKTPFYGSRRMTAWLRTQGYQVRKRVRRLMQVMGVGSRLPPAQHQQSHAGAPDLPLLATRGGGGAGQSGVDGDITYIPMAQGFLYPSAALRAGSGGHHGLAQSLLQGLVNPCRIDASQSSFGLPHDRIAYGVGGKLCAWRRQHLSGQVLVRHTAESLGDIDESGDRSGTGRGWPLDC